MNHYVSFIPDRPFFLGSYGLSRFSESGCKSMLLSILEVATGRHFCEGKFVFRGWETEPH